VPVDETNLILKAAKLFAATTGWTGTAHFRLTKRIPMGAGLGGGSSNAVAALRALNQLSGGCASETQLEAMAAQLGSDCVLFLRERPVVMRGRGERVENLPAATAARVSGRRVLVFKPSFGIATPWAYGRMIARGADYLPAGEAEARLAAWSAGDATAEELLFNNMEPAAFEKFIALPVLLARLREEFGLAPRMSGSGSACFALLRDEQAAAVIARVHECWGPAACVFETCLR
jgi:4-diphosphocytidyl-2-C-methyl-D-erythritol kinase